MKTDQEAGGDHDRRSSDPRLRVFRARPTSRTGPARSSSFPTHDADRREGRAAEALYPAETYFQYSNLGLTLAGEIVAAVPGGPYAEYVRGTCSTRSALEHDAGDARDERGKRLATGYSATRRARAGASPVAVLHRANGVAPAAGLRVDRRRPRPLRVVAVPPARRAETGGPQGHHAARDAPRPLRRSRLGDDVGARLHVSRTREDDVRRPRRIVPGLPDAAPAAAGREARDGRSRERVRASTPGVGAEGPRDRRAPR